jgi:hypothetical protein
MWHYVHLKAELTPDELTHVSDCQLCQKLFKICALTEMPSALDKELEEEERRDKSA